MSLAKSIKYVESVVRVLDPQLVWSDRLYTKFGTVAVTDMLWTHVQSHNITNPDAQKFIAYSWAQDFLKDLYDDIDEAVYDTTNLKKEIQAKGVKGYESILATKPTVLKSAKDMKELRALFQIVLTAMYYDRV